MTPGEFKTWFRYHASRFTGVAKWLGAFPKTTTGEQPTQSDVLGAWRDALSRTELDDARRATDLMHSGKEAEPRGFDRHPAAIRMIAMRLQAALPSPVSRPKRIDGKETFDCPQCRDDGRVSIWHHVSVAAAVESVRPTPVPDGAQPHPKLGEPNTVHSETVYCTCKLGDMMAPKGAIRFDAGRHLVAPIPCQMELPDEQAKVIAFVQEKLAIENHPNYHGEFADFA